MVAEEPRTPFGLGLNVWQTGVCCLAVFLPSTMFAVADSNGWIVFSIYRSTAAQHLLGVVLAAFAWCVFKRQLGAAWLFVLALSLQSMDLLNDEAVRTREAAQWRLVALSACANADRNAGLLERCRAARTDMREVSCEFGRQTSDCLVDLYRDAGWSQRIDSELLDSSARSH